MERLRQRVRSAIDARVADRATAGIVAALLVGDQAAIERADWDMFRATGVAHLMAISGLHITGLAWCAALGVGWLWRRSDVLAAKVRVTTSVSALLVGDIEAAQEQGLLQSGQALQADWLLVLHHGSATSTTAHFLEAVQPRIAVVQAGYRNRFGHPRPEVMQR